MAVKIINEKNFSWIVIDRKDKGNALNYETLNDLSNAISEQGNRDDIYAIAITGEGEKFFSGGTDLNEVLDSTDDINKSWKLMYDGLGNVIKSVLNCKLPVIAAVNGYALGAGFELIEVSDLAYAVKNAKLGLPAVKWGMIPPYSSTMGQFLSSSKLVSYLALTGEMITAEDAYKFGLINGVVDDINSLKQKVEEIANKLSSNDRRALIEIKQLLARNKQSYMVDLALSIMSAIIPRKEVKESVEKFSKK